jgi:hypothetical protein
MITRYSLYGEPAVWVDNIQSDPNGRWVTWNSVEQYVQYCREQGLNFDPIEPEVEQPTYTDAELRAAYEQYDEVEDAIEDEIELDVAAYMERHGKDDSI